MVSSYFQRSHLCPLLLLACFSCKCNICWTTFTNPTVLSSHSKHTHTTSQPGPFDHHATAQGQAFLKKTDCWGFLYPQYTLQGTVLNFSMLTMFPRSLSVEQAKKKKKICKFIIFPPIYLTPPLENEQKAYCQADRPGQNVTVCSTWAQRYI